MATQVTLNSGSVDSAGSLALKTNGTTTAVTINASQGVEFNAGTAALPAITTSGDTNTGIFFSAADTFNISTGGADKGRFSSNANGVFTVGTQGSVGGLGTDYGTLGAWGSAGGGLRIYRGTSAGTPIGTIYADAGGLFLSTSEAQPMTFSTNSTEKARITSDGNLLVGRTSSSQTSNGIEISPKFGGTANNPVISVATGQAGGTPIILYSTTASAYRFYVEGTGQINATFTTITAISDQRLKENIRDLDDGLASVMALKPRKFDWKEGKGQDIKNARGFIAQEFETVFPDMIQEWLDPAPEGEESYKAINANLIPTLVKAIQEQQALITTLTARITALESA